MIRGFFVFLILLILAGCESLNWYRQSINGHFSLLNQAEPITEVVAHPATDKALKEKLQRVLAMRDFASEELQLPDNGSYRSYVSVQRSAVLWSLVATPKLSLRLKQWCYPFTGCVTYRGYFSEADARQKASQLTAAGYDVAVLPVPAYSSLGWFDDPLPSTTIQWPDSAIAGLIFHELAHQQLYIADDTAFNESFATAVADIGVERWLARQADSREMEIWQEEKKIAKVFHQLLAEYRQYLSELYQSDLSTAQKTLQKADLLQALKAEYESLSKAQAGLRIYQNWFDQPLNNARLAIVASYQDWVPAFRELYAQHAADMQEFYRAAEVLGDLPRPARSEQLQRLLQRTPDHVQTMATVQAR
ncbi:MAG: aminopeptidase [gamma proteobacterium symbiont of Bathyaustriella thionipta]|nr:aminopeptidase [gamma proteobacterium symbiont of Bathyaustriella thionipta]